MPSACLQAKELFEQADFGCVGTNDLVQYLFAVDRTNEGIEHEGLLGHSALWDMIGELARIARKAGKPLTICGELAGDSQFTRRLMEVGVAAISVAPKRIAAVRRSAKGKSNESARPGRATYCRTGL